MASLVSRSKTRICHRRVSKASRPIESFYATANFSPALFERHHPVLATPRKNDSASGVPAPATIVVSVMDAVLILRKLATLCLLLVECKEYERIDQDVALAPTPAMLQLCWP
ncbi:uncharacterized protein PHALS_12311 [Plasmopara halstedii]|uniref:Uncharacterized protein n=1 Tax=Plasmopara halstedii TaxID=4781 RepID=A0A0P1AKS1_PLAHL|nr:uncharacterized protein PHALS_12311 [Plasmopara halstedii]CEG42004.1 hypothetical protein PHALS_12311 [Plasmopara halstedii]|eukprot:XP_024578373.1 hypothetical protein PHALS_12311 [Plasmopara halstedii]